MNLLIIILVFLFVFKILKGIVIINNKKNSSIRKGKEGEYAILNELNYIHKKHKILMNVYIPTFNNCTTEIDLIYIDKTGIYVIESKNYSGYIFGNEQDKYWLQVFHNGYKQNFYNPIWQNNMHIKYLQKILPNISAKYFKSIIVFSNRCYLKKNYTNSNNTIVINRYNLLKIINKYSKENLSNKNIDEILNILKQYTNVNNKVKQNHIKNINKIKHKQNK